MGLVEFGCVARGELFRCFLRRVSAWHPLKDSKSDLTCAILDIH